MITVYTCPKCGHELQDLIICTNPPIPEKRCFACGWHWVGEPEVTERVPFNPDCEADLQIERKEWL